MKKYDPKFHYSPSLHCFSKFVSCQRQGRGKKINERDEEDGKLDGGKKKERERAITDVPFHSRLNSWREESGGKKWNENYTSAPAASIIACLIRLDDFSARKSRARCSSIEPSRKNSESALYRIMEILIQIGAMLFPCYINNAFSKFSFFFF